MSDPRRKAIRSRLDALGSASRIGRFASVGVAGAVVDTLALFALVDVAVVEPVVAKAISWETSIVVIFVLNERWTFSAFGSSDVRALAGRFLRSNAVRAAGFLVTMGVFTALTYVAGVWYLASNVAGIGAGFVVNYTAESLYTWNVHRSGR